MIVTRTNQAPTQLPNDFEGGGFFNRLNRRLFPYLGPPPLGPYDEEPAPDAAAAACPICGAPMAEHRFDRSEPDRPTKLYCP
jgi:hypothetical protein